MYFLIKAQVNPVDRENQEATFLLLTKYDYKL